MKTLVYAFIVIAGLALTANARTAILVTHYGSSDEDTRHKTIDLITSDIRDSFPTVEVREAYISPVVRRKLAEGGIQSHSPAEALEELCRDGYDTVLVQSTTLIEGAEMAEVRDAVRERRHLFKSVLLGRPLCYSPADCEEVVGVMCATAPQPGTAIVYVGHGNNLPSTATYCQLDYMLHDRGAGNIHVSTIEGYPTAQCTVRELRSQPAVRHIVLRPLLLVCGNHTKNDIAGDFAASLGDAGFSTEVVYEGFAENPAIRRIYTHRVKEMLESTTIR